MYRSNGKSIRIWISVRTVGVQLSIVHVCSKLFEGLAKCKKNGCYLVCYSNNNVPMVEEKNYNVLCYLSNCIRSLLASDHGAGIVCP